MAGLLLAVALGFIVLAVASAVLAQSSEPADPLDLYDENENGVIDGDEAIQAIEDHFARLIDQALASKVLKLYLDAATPARGQSWPSECDEYDTNNNDVINKAEAIAAVIDYFDGTITKYEAITVIVCYFNAPTPSPTPTPTPGSAPAPTGLSATAFTAGSVTLSWNAVTDAYLYKLERSTASAGPWTSVSSTISGTGYPATGLACNTLYYFQVSARGDGSPYSTTFGDPSGTVFKRTLACPNAPTGFTVTVDRDGPDGIVLSWTAPTGEVTGYEVQRSMGSGSPSYSTIATVASYFGVGGYRDTTVMEGTTYLYRVRARNSGGDGAWTTPLSVTFKVIMGQWLVLDYKYIRIDWLIPLAERSSANQYKLVVPANTGFQINATTAPNGSKCNWQSPPSAETEWVDLGTSFYLVRCKLGTGNADIVVKKRPKSGTNRTESTVRTLEDISQSWHHADHHVSYKITSPLLGTRPSGAYQGYTTLSQRESDTGINNAASIWNHLDPLDPLWQGQTVPLTFDSVSASPDVTIKGYWNPEGTQLPEKCGYDDALACIRPGGVYPHFGRSEMWIKYPPSISGRLSYVRWTNNIDDAKSMPGTYYYLPETIMHEFGHAAGLGHSAGRSYSIMGTQRLSIVHGAPQTYDRYGMKYTYQGHTKNHP